MSSFALVDIETLKANRDIDGLLNALTNQNDSQIHEAAAYALSTIGDKRTIEPLFKIASKSSDDHIKRIVSDALVMIGTPATETLLVALMNQDSSIRHAAIAILNKIKQDWQSLEIAQATLQTIAFFKNIKGKVFIEVNNPVVEHMNASVVNEIRKHLNKIEIPITDQKQCARTVILLDWQSGQAGVYQGSAAKPVIITCSIKISDNLTSENISELMLYTSSPPEKTTQRAGDVYGEMNYEPIERFLKGLSYMPPELASFLIPVKKEDVKFLEILDHELEVASNDLNFKRRVMLNKIWVVDDTYQSTINKVLVFLDQKHIKISSKNISLTSTIVATLGDAFEARQKGTIFVDPEILPKYVRIRLVPVVKGVQINALITEAFGFGYFDSGTRKRYEVYLQNWFKTLLSDFPPKSDSTIVESPKNFSTGSNNLPGIPGAPSKPKTPKSRSTALLLEIILGVLGLPGIGWLYSERTTTGIILLISFLVWDCIALVLVVATSGIAAFCTIPISIATAAISAILLNSFMKRDEQFPY